MEVEIPAPVEGAEDHQLRDNATSSMPRSLLPNVSNSYLISTLYPLFIVFVLMF
jgi:hypothetical protein